MLKSTICAVAVIAWGGQNLTSPEDAEPVDLGAELLNQTFHELNSDANSNGLRDLEEAVRSIEFVSFFGLSYSEVSLFRQIQLNSGNDFQAAMEELLAVLNRAPDADQTQVYFLMDGLEVPSTGAEESLLSDVAAHGIDFRVGQFSGTAIDPELQRMADVIDSHAASTGSAKLAFDPDEFAMEVSSVANVAGVTVNGFGVESFDQGGNFFTTITLQPGDNLFEISAINALGEVASKQVNLIGTEPGGPTFDDFTDVTSSIEVGFVGTTFSRERGTMLAQVHIINQGDQSVRGPLRVVFEQFRPASVQLLSPTMLDPLGQPVIEFDVELGPDGLPPGATSQSLPIELSILPRERFDFQVSVLALGNTPPRFTSVPPSLARPDSIYTYSARATDDQNDRLAYEMVIGPEGMHVEIDSGQVSWTPTPDQLGVHTVVLRAHDGYGGSATQSFHVSVASDLPNQPPRFVSSPKTQSDLGLDYEYDAGAVDDDGDVLTYSLEAGPMGMKIDPVTGIVNFAQAPAGDYNVQIRAADEHGADAVQSFVLTIGDVATNASSPLILSKPATIAAVNEPYLYLPLAQDPDGDVLQFSLPVSPQGMSIDPDSGRVSWTPTAGQLGPQTVLLRVDDGRGGWATQLITVMIEVEPRNRPPVFSTVPTLFATEDQLYVYDADASDGDGDTVLFQLEQGPAGMVVDASTGLLSFLPDATQLGRQRIRLKAVDPSGQAAVQNFDLEVRAPNTAPEFTSQPLTEVVAGTAYRYDANAIDALDGVKFSLASGPAGMMINAVSGMLTFKPDNLQIGRHLTTIRVTDDRGLFTDQSFILHVSADVTPPSVSIVVSKEVILPGEQVTIDVNGSDNVKVNTYQLLIDGTELTLDGAQHAAYNATVPGLFTLAAIATDINGNVGTVTRKLRVLDPDDTTPPEITVTSPQPGDTVTYLTDVVGSIVADDLEFYRVEFARSDLIDETDITADNPAWKSIGESSNAVTDSVLAEFDPLLLLDDSYWIRIFAQDKSGNIGAVALPVSVAAPAKLGQFSLEFTDLSIPLAGIPITISQATTLSMPATKATLVSDGPSTSRRPICARRSPRDWSRRSGCWVPRRLVTERTSI